MRCKPGPQPDAEQGWRPSTVTPLALSALAMGGSRVCHFRALQIGNAPQAAPVDTSSLILVADEPLKRPHIAAPT